MPCSNWPEAARCFTNALALRADFPPAEAKLAAALAQLGRYPEAVQHYHQALKLNPDFPEAKKELAELLAAHPELK